MSTTEIKRPPGRAPKGANGHPKTWDTRNGRWIDNELNINIEQETLPQDQTVDSLLTMLRSRLTPKILSYRLHQDQTIDGALNELRTLHSQHEQSEQEQIEQEQIALNSSKPRKQTKGGTTGKSKANDNPRISRSEEDEDSDRHFSNDDIRDAIEDAILNIQVDRSQLLKPVAKQLIQAQAIKAVQRNLSISKQVLNAQFDAAYEDAMYKIRNSNSQAGSSTDPLPPKKRSRFEPMSTTKESRRKRPQFYSPT